MEGLQSIITEALTTIAVGLVGLLACYATFGLRKLTDRIKVQIDTLKSEDERKLFHDALGSLEMFTSTAVTAIEQTAAGTLREMVKDGKADWNELKQLSILAAEEIKSNLTPEVRRILEQNIGNFEEYLKNCIEAKVREIKLLK